MIRTWNAKGRGKVNNNTVVSSEYFINHDCISCGWASPYFEFKDYVVNFETYKEKWIELYGQKQYWNNQGVHHLFESVQKGDFIWTRVGGVYFVAEIPDDPINLFNIDDSQEAIDFDCVVQLKNIKWIKCGTEESVPGSVSTFTSNRNSLVRVDNKESQQNGYTATSIFSDQIVHPNKKVFIRDRRMILNLVGPSGFEDLVALWLYDKFNYIVIPSTNKKSTQTYEFVLLDGTKSNSGYTSKKRIYIQAKNGPQDLKFEEYKYLLEQASDELWLVTSGGRIFDSSDRTETEQILRYKINNGSIEKESFNIIELVHFVFNSSKIAILPNQIIMLTEMFE
jgi:hypothetical protein